MFTLGPGARIDPLDANIPEWMRATIETDAAFAFGELAGEWRTRQPVNAHDDMPD